MCPPLAQPPLERHPWHRHAHPLHHVFWWPLPPLRCPIAVFRGISTPIWGQFELQLAIRIAHFGIIMTHFGSKRPHLTKPCRAQGMTFHLWNAFFLIQAHPPIAHLTDALSVPQKGLIVQMIGPLVHPLVLSVQRHGMIVPLHRTSVPIHGTIGQTHGTIVPIHGRIVPRHRLIVPRHRHSVPYNGTIGQKAPTQRPTAFDHRLSVQHSQGIQEIMGPPHRLPPITTMVTSLPMINPLNPSPMTATH